MNTVQLRDAKAKLSALVDAAERGEATTITRHGKPAAVLVPVSKVPAGQESRVRVGQHSKKPSFAEWLLSIPGELPIERDQTPPRKVEF